MGISLSMDASAVSMTNGMKIPHLKRNLVIKMCLIFGLFQGAMPLIGYAIGYALLFYIESYIPWLALGLLSLLGLNMILTSFKKKSSYSTLGAKEIILQATATSIDALSVGLTFADYTMYQAIISFAIISGITSALCFISFYIGRKFGNRLGSFAGIIGGIILIFIGIEIFLKGV